MEIKTIRQKILGVFLLLLVIPMLLTTVLGSRVIRDYYLKLIERDLHTQAAIIATEMEPLLWRGASPGEIEDRVDSLGAKINTRITVIDIAGKVLGDSKADGRQMENHAKRKEFRDALHGFTGVSVHYSKTLDKEFIYVAIPLRAEGKVIGAVRSSLPLEELDEISHQLGATLMGITLLLILIALIIAIRFSKGLTTPIEEMTDLAGEIARGNFIREIAINSKDELGQLASAFNSMSHQLSSTISALENERGKLGAVLSSISDGVIATDRGGKILFLNPSVEKIFHIPEMRALGKPFLEAIRNSEIYDLIREVNKNGQVLRREVVIGEAERIFAVYGSPITREGTGTSGVVILLRDITEIKALEQMKTDFVANVSHELRTPLTSIKGFVETLLDGAHEDEKMRERFLRIIDNEADRLINLVRDLLDLSQLESGQIALKLEMIDLAQLIKKSMELLQDKIKGSKATMICEIPPDLPQIEGDFFRLQEVFINLLDNALKFTPEGEIRIKARVMGEHMEIQVSDTGIGIPAKDQARLFERFYRVDKGRDRKSGGTGLGLSIVKHTIAVHHGSIHVESKEGKGTTFIIHLPLKQPKREEK